MKMKAATGSAPSPVAQAFWSLRAGVGANYIPRASSTSIVRVLVFVQSSTLPIPNDLAVAIGRCPIWLICLSLVTAPEAVAKLLRYCKDTLVELRGLSSDGSVGLQTVVPPSIHETGELVRFEQGFEGIPENIAAEELVPAVHRVAAAALLARHWPREGSRHHAFLALAGVFARAGWSLENAMAFHRAIYKCLWPATPELGAADTEVQSTFEKHSAGGETTGVPTLIKILNKKVGGTFTQRLRGTEHLAGFFQFAGPGQQRSVQ